MVRFALDDARGVKAWEDMGSKGEINISHAKGVFVFVRGRTRASCVGLRVLIDGQTHF